MKTADENLAALVKLGASELNKLVKVAVQQGMRVSLSVLSAPGYPDELHCTVTKVL